MVMQMMGNMSRSIIDNDDDKKDGDKEKGAGGEVKSRHQPSPPPRHHHHHHHDDRNTAAATATTTTSWWRKPTDIGHTFLQVRVHKSMTAFHITIFADSLHILWEIISSIMAALLPPLSPHIKHLPPSIDHRHYHHHHHHHWGGSTHSTSSTAGLMTEHKVHYLMQSSSSSSSSLHGSVVKLRLFLEAWRDFAAEYEEKVTAFLEEVNDTRGCSNSYRVKDSQNTKMGQHQTKKNKKKSVTTGGQGGGGGGNIKSMMMFRLLKGVNSLEIARKYYTEMMWDCCKMRQHLSCLALRIVDADHDVGLT